MSISFKCLICDKDFSNKFNLTKHNNKIKPCKSANVQIIPNVSLTQPAINETNEINALKNEVLFLRQEISEIKELLLSFINPSSSIIKPVELIQPVEPIKKPKKIKTNPINQVITDPINSITPYEEDENIYNKLNGEFNNRSCIFQQLETKILTNDYFKNIEITDFNDKTGDPETQTITVLTNPDEFINELYQNKKSIKYVDKMRHYIEIYKPVLNKNLKSYIYHNQELFFKIGNKWEYEDDTPSLLRESLQETIKKVVFNTINQHNENKQLIEYLFDLNRTYGDDESNKQVNKLLRELFVC